MDIAIIIAIVGMLQAVVVAIIAGLFNRENKKRAAETAEAERRRTEEAAKVEKRAALRAEESRLAMRLMSANTSLAIATGMAVKEGKTNGKMDAALVEAANAQGDYFKFINSVASTQMAAE